MSSMFILRDLTTRWEVKDSDLVARNYRFTIWLENEIVVTFSTSVNRSSVFLLMELQGLIVPIKVIVCSLNEL